MDLRREWVEPIASIEMQVAHSFIVLLNKFLKDCKISQSYEENIKKINFISAYCIIWSVGSSIETVSYGPFESALRNLVQNVFFPKT